ncbi:MAG: thioesterase family protein [Gemmatimonadetes bacterium]|nr:thioesterase family protein [Gemmatimonadota bacterium]
MQVVFERQDLVRFGHCDPAGIVYFPRYFEMLNALIEDWFTEGLGVDFAEFTGTRRMGIPTVHLTTHFKQVSRVGDRLTQRIAIQKIGRSSLVLNTVFEASDGVRVSFEHVVVCTSLETHRPIPFPPDLRSALERAIGASHA